ncbi:aldo/keto reductase [uncultured Methanobrevibacter sp.]|uniref:aldo/keto reductase n=1 Tax=uncultured Methanobrevibacter sp. TaxID=253161 RepID=UPI0025F1C16B|nr:aldo/keto reductase [uncultured Methanobrevibacter sp.]
MAKIILGKTELEIEKNGFGALPIQRDSFDESAEIVRKAYHNGINFFDTARAYTDSEEKLNYAFKGFNEEYPRESIIIASKTQGENRKDIEKDIKVSLDNLGTDYIDLYQIHNPSFCPTEGDGSGAYDALFDLLDEGTIRHIGFTSHKAELANEAIDSGLYETIQFPFSYLTGQKELALVEKARANNVGFIAMKAMSGGLNRSSKAAYAYINSFDNVVPIWGIQRMSELDEFLSYMKEGTKLDEKLEAIIKSEREELQGDFCRGCAYCMPCPQDIQIFICVRMSLWMRRFPTEPNLDEATQEKMKQIEECTECGQCISKCPYELNIPDLLKKNYEDYKKVLSGETIIE